VTEFLFSHLFYFEALSFSWFFDISTSWKDSSGTYAESNWFYI